jgi:ribonuclease-3
MKKLRNKKKMSPNKKNIQKNKKNRSSKFADSELKTQNSSNKSASNSEIQELARKLNVKFNNLGLLETALTHRSYLNENRKVKEHNERLEFLGDAVLELIVTEYLFENCPNKAEGELTSFRSASVKTDTLAKLSRNLEYGQYLRMSRGEERTGGRDKDYLLANTFEAVLGSIYLDRGFKECEKFLKRVIFPEIDYIIKHRLDIDPKTQFQEEAQEHFKTTPTYKVIKESGPDHDKTFVVGVFIGKKELGKGTGPSKQKAEEEAATQALENIS